MSEEQKRKTENKIMYLSFGVLGLAVVYLILIGVTGLAESAMYPIGIGVFLMIYWAMSDLLPIRWLKILEDKTEEQKKAYGIYALLDAGSFAGLAYFIMNLESLTGVILYAGCTYFKRSFRDRYLGKAGNKEEDFSEEESPENAVLEENIKQDSEADSAGPRTEGTAEAESDSASSRVEGTAESDSAGPRAERTAESGSDYSEEKK